jgi:hypothetical protein
MRRKNRTRTPDSQVYKLIDEICCDVYYVITIKADCKRGSAFIFSSKYPLLNVDRHAKGSLKPVKTNVNLFLASII